MHRVVIRQADGETLRVEVVEVDTAAPQTLTVTTCGTWGVNFKLVLNMHSVALDDTIDKY